MGKENNQDFLFIDLETRSFVNLPKYGIGPYIEDPTTDVICFAYALNDNEPKMWWPGDPVPPEFLNHTGFYVAHNVLFDYSLIKEVLCKKYNFPKTLTDYTKWYCTRALAVSVGLPGSLNAAGQVLSKNKNEQKEKTGSYLIKKYSEPQKDRKTGEFYFKELTKDDKKLMVKYNTQDVRVSQNIFNLTFDLPNNAVDREIFLLDFKQNLHGLPIDIKSVNMVVDVLNNAKIKAEQEMEKIGVNVRSQPEMLKFFRSNNIMVSDIQADTIKHILEKTDNLTVKKICELRQFLGKASVKKFEKMIHMVSRDNYLRYYMLYYGAHTGRASSKGVQLHNLPRSKTNEKDIENNIKTLKLGNCNFSEIIPLAKSVLPGMIKAEPGFTFLMGDFAAIEARGVAYLAGEEKLINQFLNKEKVYENMASVIFNKPVDTIGKDSFERFVGKGAVLGCGYGMGVDKFMSISDIDYELAEKAVNDYRTTYSKIPEFWGNLTKGFLHVFRRPEDTVYIGNYLVVDKVKNYIRIKLPSGRYMYYHNIKVKSGNYGPELSYYNFLQKRQVKIWGGILAENVTQSICRDILYDCMLRADKVGLNPLLQVHDEVICYVQKRNIKEKETVFLDIMNTPPEWLPGFPLETEIEISGRYHK